MNFYKVTFFFYMYILPHDFTKYFRMKKFHQGLDFCAHYNFTRFLWILYSADANFKIVLLRNIALGNNNSDLFPFEAFTLYRSYVRSLNVIKKHAFRKAFFWKVICMYIIPLCNFTRFLGPFFCFGNEVKMECERHRILLSQLMNHKVNECSRFISPFGSLVTTVCWGQIRCSTVSIEALGLLDGKEWF